MNGSAKKTRLWYLSRRDIIPAPPARVWRALTDPSELALWWCSHATLEVRKGGLYLFGGPHVFGEDPAARRSLDQGKPGDFEILDMLPEERLEFRWWLGEVETVVRYELVNLLELTQLTVYQSGDEPLVWEIAPDMPNWWWVAIPALRSYVENGTPDLRIDYEAIWKTPRVEFSVGFFTFPWVIWSKLTDPNELNRWWARRAEVELRQGGKLNLGLEAIGPETILEVDAGSRLVHDWSWGEGKPAARVEWLLEETTDTTRVTVRDVGPWHPDSRRDFLAVYWASTLLNLKRMSERGISPRENQVG